MARGDYSFVIDSTFQPFTMQEMLTPFVMYKDAYEKTEEAYNDLTQKADTFKYLADVAEENPDSKAAKIYKGYANELDKQAKDLAKNGLSMLNRRALTNLKRRYQGEIGMLARADEQLKELQKQRNALIASGKSMLYANENPTLDDFLEGNESFNRYSIDQDTLRALGMQEGQAASSRIYGSTKVNDITKYYQEILQTQGYSPELINQFRQSLEAIPEFRDAVNSIMEERGINQNLKGVNWQRAKDSIVNGIIAGSVYKEARNVQRNPGVMDAYQEASNALGWANHALSKENVEFNRYASGYEKDASGKWIYKPSHDLSVQKAVAVTAAKGTGKSSGVAYDARNKTMTMVGSKTGSVYKQDGTEGKGTSLDETPMRALTQQEYAQLIDAYGNITNQYLRSAIGNGQLSDYEIYVIPSGSTELSGTGWFDNDDLDEDVYVAIPRESKRSATEYNGGSSSGSGGGTNDIPK